MIKNPSQNILTEFITDLEFLKVIPENSDIIHILKNSSKLKTIPRQGWVDKLDISKPESVADHVFSVAFMSMIFADMERLDTTKVMKMALLHDLAESIIGDLTPDEIDKIRKEEMENEALNRMLVNLPQKDEYIRIWSEFRENQTEEARLVHEIDKLEMIFQATYYVKKEKIEKEKILPFIKTAKNAIQTPNIKEILNKLLEEIQ